MKNVTNTQKGQKYLQSEAVLSFFPPAFQKQLQVIQYKAGESLCQQDADLTALAIVLAGKIKMVRRLFNGREYILDIKDTITIIGEIELMTGRPNVSSVISLTDSWVIQLPLTADMDLLADATFLTAIGQSLAHSLYQQNIRASTNLGYTVHERLVSHILQIEVGGQFTLELNTLADTFGTSYRHLLRTVKNLVDSGAISKKKKNYTIVDRLQLEVAQIVE